MSVEQKIEASHEVRFQIVLNDWTKLTGRYFLASLKVVGSVFRGLVVAFFGPARIVRQVGPGLRPEEVHEFSENRHKFLFPPPGGL